MTRSQLVGPERQTDGLSADHAGAFPAQAGPSRRSLCACPCGPWPATPARRSEPGSSPFQNLENPRERLRVNRSIDDDAPSTSQHDLDAPLTGPGRG